MSSPLNDIWEAASATPYHPTIAKSAQFTAGFTLLIFAFILTGIFGLNRSIVNLPLLGIPASLAFGFGAVYMICAVGVYV
ncbi:hypothetical protein K432DRAFT_407924 [Lepidopterella palustris CBS 459.81]|uniref:Dolichyl-diphosphooligosaccharide-protein glycosyltransferase subunit OST5 n=1 Tax=Lepidopterella palustris CBS 459.81 TaxID=1314670 RepID=A0A8E2E3X8_9PEZI|nr:hypothetical protein K432DRAFT_407924 [Lepidopterella palustris CBS 459.81]